MLPDTADEEVPVNGQVPSLPLRFGPSCRERFRSALFSKGAPKPLAFQKRIGAKGALHLDAVELITFHETKSLMSEAYRTCGRRSCFLPVQAIRRSCFS